MDPYTIHLNEKMAHTTNILVIDTEGVGWPREIGAVSINLETFEFDPFQIVIAPQIRESMILPINKRPTHVIEDDQYKRLQTQLAKLNEMCAKCDIVMAHNVGVDQKMLSLIEELKPFEDKLWVCTMNHFPWPIKPKTKSLQSICEAQGVTYENEHTAVNDAQMVVACLVKIPQADLQMCLRLAHIQAYERQLMRRIEQRHNFAPKKVMSQKKRKQMIWRLNQKRAKFKP